MYRARHEERADRDVAARERLRDRDEIRFEAPVLEGEHPARSPEPGHHLVDAEERPVAAAQLLGALEVPVGRQMDSLPLHRFDDEERDVLTAQLLLEPFEVSEWNLLESREKRL